MKISVRIFLFIMFFMFVNMMNANATSITFYENDFSTNSLNGLTPSGNSVVVEDGMLKLYQNVTDQGGGVSLKINPLSDGKITLKQSSYVHYANDFFFGSVVFYGYPASSESVLFSFGHFNDIYDNQYGFGFSDYPSYQNTTVTTAIWDKWIDETLTYDPASGITTYSLNGDTPIVYQGKAFSGDILDIQWNTYGWWTGHFTFLDNISLTQSDSTPSNAPVPEPTTLILMGSGLIALAAKKRKKQ